MRSMSGIGQQQLVPEHQVGDELVRQLVDRGGGVAVAGAERLDIAVPWVIEPEAVHVGVAEVDADRVAAVRVDLRGEPVGDVVEGLVPADLLPAVSPAGPRPGARVGAAGRGRRGCPRARTPWGRCGRARAGRRGCRGRPSRARPRASARAADRLAEVAHAEPRLHLRKSGMSTGPPQRERARWRPEWSNRGD